MKLRFKGAAICLSSLPSARASSMWRWISDYASLHPETTSLNPKG
jgi:hypothetical protein